MKSIVYNAVRLILCAQVMLFPLVAYGQEKLAYFYDINDDDGRRSDTFFNKIGKKYEYSCKVIDGQMVKELIGIDRHYIVDPDSTENPARFPMWIKGIGANNDSVLISGRYKTGVDEYGDECNVPMNIGGTEYRCVNVWHYTKKNYRLLSLDEVRQLYCGHWEEVTKENCLYMINKFFIMKNADQYRVDSSFIYRVELVSSEDFDFFRGIKAQPFYIIRIFTKTIHNMIAYRNDDIWEWDKREPHLSW